jgi:hypothetical protein
MVIDVVRVRRQSGRSVSLSSIVGVHEPRLAGPTIHEIGLPESGYSPPTPYAAKEPTASVIGSDQFFSRPCKSPATRMNASDPG